MAAKQKELLSQPHHDERDHDHDRESHHIRHLERKIKLVSNALARLGRGLQLQELLVIIHRPGWTTISEFELVNAILDDIGSQVRGLERLQNSLVAAANKVGQK